MNELQSFLKPVVSSGRELRNLESNKKNLVLLKLAELLKTNSAQIQIENKKDLDLLPATALVAFRDRLTLTSKRVEDMVEGLLYIANLQDPIGEIIERKTLPNLLMLKKTRVPIGVILFIFESRPNVAIDSFALAFKSGNAILLRAGKEAKNTVHMLSTLIHEALKSEGIDVSSATFIQNSDREFLKGLLKCKKEIDVVIPRGGEGLISFIDENCSIPIIKNDRGMCHVYIDEEADFAMALDIVKNAKTQRPGVCNAMETLLVNAKIAEKFLPILFSHLDLVEFHCCEKSFAILKNENSSRIKKATEQDFDTEYLDLILNCKLVESLEEAIQHIEAHGSRHSESIVTSNEAKARNFQKGIDAAVVYWNASTRFTDGFEFGLGGEIGISTQKLHVRGPVGLKELTCQKWVVDGSGQVRR